MRRERIVPDEMNRRVSSSPTPILRPEYADPAFTILHPSTMDKIVAYDSHGKLCCGKNIFTLAVVSPARKNNVQHQRRTKRGRLPSLKVLLREKKTHDHAKGKPGAH